MILGGLRRSSAVAEIDSAQLAAELAQGRPVQLVDVREADEWRVGRIPGSVHIPLGQLLQRRGELDPQRPVVAVCRSGNRSSYATTALQQAGFTDVRNLAGGIGAWARSGRAVTR
jgi:adenylyltransferase/sulfurtransferase